MPKQLIEAPASTADCVRETLAYVESYDAPNNDDYAFVAYKETDANGEWRVRIQGLRTPGAVFEPEAIRLQARSAGAQGKPWFAWGWGIESGPGESRCVQFRVHIAGGRASEVEMFVQTRKFDGTPDEPRTARFAWPG